jgi:hypothetical protein
MGKFKFYSALFNVMASSSMPWLLALVLNDGPTSSRYKVQSSSQKLGEGVVTHNHIENQHIRLPVVHLITSR